MSDKDNMGNCLFDNLVATPGGCSDGELAITLFDALLEHGGVLGFVARTFIAASFFNSARLSGLGS
ncbi:hypothetical protein E2562_010367 [Oryza meyeriana var. granulata]|uniref:Uncharacterized protein n=1 Tax=Oryza meyeriana var. granulata TaxID=110450 RepID=A0A6G1F6C5_9ORYZ|nr:hypothetical protein E2562_010367 [Oryza meyeriana var. granulata]